MATKMLKRLKSSTVVTHTAVCDNCDFVGKETSNLATAQKEGLEHQRSAGLGHKVHIVTKVKSNNEFVSDLIK